ncbi:MAG: DUF4783 domain-containing protein [Crocinitomicaceae bacterium]|nr:DUF4783 domain-containing protein [Crocinitomicaceae bacterium]
MSFAYSFLIAFIFSFVNPADVPYSELETAFSTGNATAISNMGKEKMLISILDKEAAYSQSQATLVLKDFFSKKPATSFKFNFKGKESADGSFAIGIYTSKAESFRVSIHFKKMGNDFKIERLTIEKN